MEFTSHGKKPLVPFLVIVIAVLAIQVIVLYKQISGLKQNPQQIAQEVTKELIAEVGELILLPADEAPTVATVSDPEKLKDQPFFANAKAGDKVLIYTKAKKAFLYDPVGHKVVEVAPVNLGNPEGSPPKKK